MGNALVLVWRESLEAMLVIGILYACVLRLDAGRTALKYLWLGVLGGIALSVLVAFISFRIQTQLQGQALQHFQTAVLLIAAALITQMVLWMNKHGRYMKRELEDSVAKATSASGLLGIALVAALAVGREGSEIVIFLYGMGVQASGLASVLQGAVLGLLLGFFTAWAVSKGVRGMSYRTFFKVTGIALLFLASGLLVSAVSNLISGGVLPALVARLWDTTWLLDEQSMLGGIVAAFTGYRAHPSLLLLLVYITYWASVLGWMKWRNTSAATPPPVKPLASESLSRS